MPKSKSSLTDLFRITTPAAALALSAVTPSLHAQEDMTKPEIKVEKKKDVNGKESVYMYIDGVKVHETDTAKQPLPPVVTPGDKPGAPPSDAVVLFDGSADSFSANWTDTKGDTSKWKVADGAMESVRGAGYVQSEKKFGSCQFHIEWASPSKVQGSGQGRGIAGFS